MLKMSRNMPALKIDGHVAKLESKFKEGIKLGAYFAGSSVVQEARSLLDSGSRTGTKYSNLPNRSSAPGENPRTQSGELAKSVYFDAGSVHEFRVGAKAKHAKYLEFGTKHIKARPHPSLPWLQLAIELEERNTERYLRDCVLKEIEC
jgi:hypothetical protein